MTAPRRVLAGMGVALAIAGGWQLAAAGWIHAKAALAQHFIAEAWDMTRASGLPQRPWRGADLRPVARLEVPRHGVKLIVLDNAAARALAFGPGHLQGSAPLASDGNAVVVAHRDTHFAFLKAVAPGDEIAVQSLDSRARYRVRETRVVHQSDTQVIEGDGGGQLTLVTCFPFDAARPGTELRFVVVADRIA